VVPSPPFPPRCSLLFSLRTERVKSPIFSLPSSRREKGEGRERESELTSFVSFFLFSMRGKRGEELAGAQYLSLKRKIPGRGGRFLSLLD